MHNSLVRETFMDNKNVNKEISEPSQPVQKNKIQKERTDDAYTQINQIAFQQNFKALIGHFKKDLNYNPQAFR